MLDHPAMRIILIDDHRHTHELVSLALANAEDMVLVAHGSNGAEALQLCEEHHPDLILLDVMMPVLDGIQTAQIIRQRFPTVKILVLSSFQDDESIHAMLRSGADGYVLKGALSADLANTIRAVQTGNQVFSPQVTEVLRHTPPSGIQTNQTFSLTEREIEVLRLMADGSNNNEIAAALFISVSTVKFHIANILHKMNVQTRAEAIVLAAKNALI